MTLIATVTIADVSFVTYFRLVVENTLDPPLERNPDMRQIVSIGGKLTVSHRMGIKCVKI